jgi:hypothetical protein
MTTARKVLECLAMGDGTAQMLAERSGLPLEDVREALRTLRKGNRVCSVAVPTIYKATEAGGRALQKAPTPPAILKRKKLERHSREERARSMVGLAIEQQPQLAQVWR